jgi:uncharacterized C2H2 Zn-finger protein
MKATYKCPKCGCEIKREIDCGYEEYRKLENCPKCGQLFAVTLSLMATVYTLQQYSSKMNEEVEKELKSKVAAMDTVAKITRKRKIQGVPRDKTKKTVYPIVKPEDDYLPYGVQVSAGAFSVNHAHFRGKLIIRANQYNEHKKSNDSPLTWHEWVVANCAGAKNREID